MVNSGLGVACLEIWFQNRSVAPVSRSLPHRTRRTGEDDHSIIRRERRAQGKIKGRCAAPAVSGSQRPIHPALIVTPGNRERRSAAPVLASLLYHRRRRWSTRPCARNMTML